MLNVRYINDDIDVSRTELIDEYDDCKEDYDAKNKSENHAFLECCNLKNIRFADKYSFDDTKWLHEHESNFVIPAEHGFIKPGFWK